MTGASEGYISARRPHTHLAAHSFWCLKVIAPEALLFQSRLVSHPRVTVCGLDFQSMKPTYGGTAGERQTSDQRNDNIFISFLILSFHVKILFGKTKNVLLLKQQQHGYKKTLQITGLWELWEM